MITHEDLASITFDATAAKRVSAEIAERRKTNPHFTLHHLRREVNGEDSSREAAQRSRLSLAPSLSLPLPPALSSKKQQTAPKQRTAQTIAAPPRVAARNDVSRQALTELEAAVLELPGIDGVQLTDAQRSAYRTFLAHKPMLIAGGYELVCTIADRANLKTNDNTAIRAAADAILDALRHSPDAA